ncbi:MAG: VTT domain-containing protein [Mariniblastus sp.]|nr:VTT domain-containing protein [Mariniblastus sp.]
MKFSLVTATLVIITLSISIIPFLLWGEQLEKGVQPFFEQDWLAKNPILAGLLVIGVLASDILLPIPSSVVCTFAGRIFGMLVGTLICWAGLNLSSAVGYLAGSRFGWPLARRFCREESLLTAERKFRSWGVWPLVLMRGLPVLAEASVLIAGIYRFPARLFWPPILFANLGVVMAYVALGGISAKNGWFPLAASISLGIPVAFLVMWHLAWKSRRSPGQSSPEKEL